VPAHLSHFAVSMASALIPAEVVEKTITNFTELDASGDKRTMTRMARRLGKEQPALLQYAARFRDEHGDSVGEAAVFYGTLVWAMFDEKLGKCPKLTTANIIAAEVAVEDEISKVDAIKDKPVHERTAEALVEKQPHIYSKLVELIEEDVREDAMSEETAEIIYPPTQVILEAFDAAVEGRRPGQEIGPVVRETPKVGRNEPCPCGSGKKFKRCCSA
jgi:hypothetical protein